MESVLKNHKLSIVITCYNSFSLMGKLFDSLENQTNKNFEVLIIDDKSTDDSFMNCVKYSENTNLKIIVLQNETNSGPGVSRNNGIEITSNEFITFVDSDDSLSNIFVDSIITAFLTHDLDAYIFDYKSIISNKSYYKKTCNVLNYGLIQTEDALKYTYGGVWCKAYKTRIIKDNKIKFPSIYRNEDVAFTKTTLSYCSKIYYDNKALYYYYDNPFSIMNTKKYINNNNSIIAYDYIKNNINKDYLSVYEYLKYSDCIYSIICNMYTLKMKKKLLEMR